MEYRRLGNSGLRASKVALGGWMTFGDSIHETIAQIEELFPL